MGAAGIGLHCVAQDDMLLMQGRILEIQQLKQCYCWQINCEMSSNSRDKNESFSFSVSQAFMFNAANVLATD